MYLVRSEDKEIWDYLTRPKAKEKQMLDEVFALQGDAYDAAETKTRTYEILPVK